MRWETRERLYGFGALVFLSLVFGRFLWSLLALALGL